MTGYGTEWPTVLDATFSSGARVVVGANHQTKNLFGAIANISTPAHINGSTAQFTYTSYELSIVWLFGEGSLALFKNTQLIGTILRAYDANTVSGPPAWVDVTVGNRAFGETRATYGTLKNVRVELLA